MQIRPALPADIAAITAIYGHHVLHGTGTFEEEPPPSEEMAGRLAKVQSRGWPWLVAERDGSVIGYAYTAQFRDRAAYRFAGEDSIYIHPDEMGAGVGGAGRLGEQERHAERRQACPHRHGVIPIARCMNTTSR